MGERLFIVGKFDSGHFSLISLPLISEQIQILYILFVHLAMPNPVKKKISQEKFYRSLLMLTRFFISTVPLYFAKNVKYFTLLIDSRLLWKRFCQTWFQLFLDGKQNVKKK